MLAETAAEIPEQNIKFRIMEDPPCRIPSFLSMLITFITSDINLEF